MKKILVLISLSLFYFSNAFSVTLYDALNQTFQNNIQLNAERENIKASEEDVNILEKKISMFIFNRRDYCVFNNMNIYKYYDIKNINYIFDYFSPWGPPLDRPPRSEAPYPRAPKKYRGAPGAPVIKIGFLWGPRGPRYKN